MQNRYLISTQDVLELSLDEVNAFKRDSLEANSKATPPSLDITVRV